jgi:hypothetical protein
MPNTNETTMPETTTAKPKVFIHDAILFINNAIEEAINSGSVPALKYRGLPDVEHYKTETSFPGYNLEFGDIFGSSVNLYLRSQGYGDKLWSVEVGTSGCCRTLEHSQYLAKSLVGTNALAAKLFAFLESVEVVATPEAKEKQAREEEAAVARWKEHRAWEAAQIEEKKRLRYLKASVTRKFNKVIAAGVLQQTDIMRIQGMIDQGKYAEVKALLN